VVFGDLEESDNTRDDLGYLLGPSAGGRKIILKKYGFAIAGMPFGPLPKGDLTVEYFKAGGRFTVRINGTTVFDYVDLELLDRGETWISLFRRQPRPCTLRSVRLGVRPVGAPLPVQKAMVKVLNGRENHYFLNRIDSFFLSRTEGDYTAFRLHDVTEFQRRVRHLEDEQRKLSRLLETYRKREHPFIGSGKSIMLVREKADTLAGSSATVLIQGPTGSGKEVLAGYIHRRSAFAQGPFVKVDCSTIPATLMESVLFGHERGAFTGAHKRRTGLFEAANQGTLFLDEINNLGPDVQAKLLQFLQDFQIFRVGGNRPIALSLRILAAANLDLKDMVKAGLFREDLYYRIAVATIDLPPLRERPEDLPALVNFFLEQSCRENRKPISGLSPGAHRKLHAYAWPGNVRELKNVIERAVLFCRGEVIGQDLVQLPDQDKAASPQGPGRRYRPVDMTRRELLALAKRHRGVVQDMIRETGASRRAFYYHLEKMGLKPNDLRKVPRRRRRKR
jgi:DNA-binding NtrC family response regulator